MFINNMSEYRLVPKFNLAVVTGVTYTVQTLSVD